jgi:hypothetical protein
VKKGFILLLFITLFYSTYVFSQNWVHLSKGVPLPNSLNWRVEPVRNDLFLIGMMFFDGEGNTLRGLAKWDGQGFIPYAGEMPLNPISFSIFRYRDSLYITTALSWDEKNWLAYYDETKHKLDTVSDKTLYGPIFSTYQDGEKLYVNGAFTKCGEDTTWGFCMYDGHTWTSLFSQGRPSGNSDDFEDFVWYKNKLYVGGNFYLPGPNGNVQDVGILENGELYSFGGGINFTGMGFSNALAVYKDELYIAGYFVSANGIPVNNIVRWDGIQFKEVGGGADNFINDMIVYDGNLYICGPFTNVGGIYAPNIARWDGENWHSFIDDDFHTDVQTAITDMQIYNQELYITGGFTIINSDTFNCVAKYAHQLPGTENGLQVFINNTDEEVIVEFEDSNQYILGVAIYTVTGQQVVSHLFPPQSGYFHQSIPITGLASGIYIVEAIAGNKKISRKLLKL